jgi:outer membrane receptor protein involved in Fe transport
MPTRTITGLCSALATVACITSLVSPSAAAQEASLGLEEVIVTARKTEERLIDAPLSITAFSADDIEEKGFKTLEDVARSAPGVQYSQQGGQIPGRFTSAIRFRGMNVNSDSPSLQLGSLFVDGIYVLGGTQSIPYDDVERIEVIKGPQSATYGRSTFGGAINYITRTPSLTEYSGRLNATGANYGRRVGRLRGTPRRGQARVSRRRPLLHAWCAVQCHRRWRSRRGIEQVGATDAVLQAERRLGHPPAWFPCAGRGWTVDRRSGLWLA